MTKKKTTQEDMYAKFNEFEGSTEGYEEITLDTMAVPFIRVLQDMSPQCKKTKPEYNPEAEPGMLCNSVSGRLYPAPLRFVVGKFERLYLEWKPNRGSFVGAHTVEHVEQELITKLIRDDKNKLIDPATGNNFTDTYMYYVLLPDAMEEGICILSLSSTQIKEAKKLNKNLVSTIIPGSAKKALPFFMIWNLDTASVSNDHGDWMGIQISFDSFVDQPQLEYVVQERAELPNKTVDYAQLEEKTSESSSDANKY